MALNLGGIIRLTYTVKDVNGTLVNPSTATLTIIQPDGTTATPTVTLPPAATGVLVVDYTPSQFGLHSVHWGTTVPGTAEDDVFVAEPPATMLVSVDEAVDKLATAGINVTGDAERERLQWQCMVVTNEVESRLNRAVVRRTVTETYDGGVPEISLRTQSVISVTTVVENGTTLTAGQYFLRRAAGTLARGTPTSRLWWQYGAVVITYEAGYVNPPRVIRQVALDTLQNLWQLPVTDVQVGQVAITYGTPALEKSFMAYWRPGTA